MHSLAVRAMDDMIALSTIADTSDEEIVRPCHVNPRLNRIRFDRVLERGSGLDSDPFCTLR